MTRRAHRERAERAAREWRKTETLIAGALDHFLEVRRPDVETERRLRNVERTASGVGRALGAEPGTPHLQRVRFDSRSAVANSATNQRRFRADARPPLPILPRRRYCRRCFRFEATGDPGRALQVI
jgi:hypothetical protein